LNSRKKTSTLHRDGIQFERIKFELNQSEFLCSKSWIKFSRVARGGAMGHFRTPKPTLQSTRYCNKRVLSPKHMLILNVCLTTNMHGLYTSTQHLNKSLEPLNWIRVWPSRRDKHSRKHSHVLYYVSCNSSKYTTFKPHTRPSFDIFIPSNGSHLIDRLELSNFIYKNLILRGLFKQNCGFSTPSPNALLKINNYWYLYFNVQWNHLM
jgi:hypothetical protein